MEAMLNFVNKFANVIESHLEETKQYLGKDVVDCNAVRTGICIDKIKLSFGAKFSLLGHNYSDREVKEIEGFGEDVLVCQGNNGRFFLPASAIGAVGDTVLLISEKMNYPESTVNGRTREDVFRKYFKVKESLKTVLPQLKEPAKARKKRKIGLHLFH